MKTVIQRIVEASGPIYRGSAFYKHTIWHHAQRVSKFARDFAEKIGADKFIAEVGGLLHDLGGAKYGAENHHITGCQEAVLVLLRCGCPLESVGPILSTIYSHRGSQRITFLIPEAKCVAAADALDHFTALKDLWMVQTQDLGLPEMMVYQTVSDKLERDWDKTDPEIRLLLGGEEAYKMAKQKLLEIASVDTKHGKSKKRGKPSIKQ